VLSTIHTNDAAGAVTRLVEMEIESFLVRSSVIGILAQRLVRLLCSECRESYSPSDLELKQIGLDPERLAWRRSRRLSPKYVAAGRRLRAGRPRARAALHVYRAKGCRRAFPRATSAGAVSTSFSWSTTRSARSSCGASDAQSLKRAAVEQGMDTLRDDGARKVLLGLTTVEEVLAATQEDVVVE